MWILIYPFILKVFYSWSTLVVFGYLYVGHPEHADVEDAVRDESGQVQSQEVQVQTYNTDIQSCQRQSFCLEFWTSASELGSAAIQLKPSHRPTCSSEPPLQVQQTTSDHF